MALFGWLPIPLAPLNTVLSLLLMQGISLSMWRQFLNQTIPPLNLQRLTQNRPRFTFSLSNTQATDVGMATVGPPRVAQGYQSLGLMQSGYQQQNVPYQIQPVQPVPMHQMQPIQMQPMQVQAMQPMQQLQMQSLPPQVIVMSNNGHLQKTAPATVVQQVPAPIVVQKQINPPVLTTIIGQASTTVPVQIPAPKRKDSDESTSAFVDIYPQKSRKSLVPPPPKVPVIDNKEDADDISRNDEFSDVQLHNEVDTHKGNIKSRINFFQRVCYYLLESEGEALYPKEIDPYLCTHIIAGYAFIDDNYLAKIRMPEVNLEKFRQLKKLKNENKDLRLLLSINGDNDGERFVKMKDSLEEKEKFIKSVVDIIITYNFDGIDLNLESIGGKSTDNNFINLIKKLRNEAKKSGKPDFIVSVAFATPPAKMTISYEINLLSNVADFVNLIAYDYHYYRPDRPYTGHHSALFARNAQHGDFATLNAAWSTSFLISQGMPPEKILIGIPTFARTYNLAFPFTQGLDAPVTGNGLGGGRLNYTQVCKFLADGARSEYDSSSQVPYAFKNYDWIAYENEKSVSVKARWVAKSRLGGVMTFSLNDDDWKAHQKWANAKNDSAEGRSN
ncbi:chitinase-like protein 3 [Dinothrombium tinctorium]|uniref:Chitinase-like protein 3 n=1 Tax=Dinothrombium tinctorium TaxID=1965070 RepID=A0A3S3Q531_9ACAR|nr:chitinase-like protein 3 [Dinothrombium tinctorium]RWS14106.1 chitinase-like protein 3 [Dinothrombium tinctorium]RWS14142.1 chitinase-like protein 3 [Dinothrombium tinctorium]